MNDLEESNTEFADTQQLSVLRASLPAALKRYSQKLDRIGKPRLMPTLDEQHEQFYCGGYCDAIYDLTVGNVQIQSVRSDQPKSDSPKIVRL